MPEEEKLGYVPAERFRRMSSTGVIMSIDNALKVLEGRGGGKLSGLEAELVLDIASRLTDLGKDWVSAQKYVPAHEHEVV
jgi:hypothetical protein